MRNEKSLRKNDGFLDDLINLFFLRPVFRESKVLDQGGQHASKKDDLGGSEGKEFSTGKNRADHTIGAPKDTTKIPLPLEIFGAYVQNKDGGSSLKIQSAPITFDQILNSEHFIEVKKYDSSRLTEDLILLSKKEENKESLILRFIDEVNSLKEDDEDIENQPPLIPIDQIPDVKPRGDDHS